MEFKKLEPLSQQRVENVIGWVQQSNSYQDLMMRVLAIVGDLKFGVNSDAFEQAFDELGRAIGFAAERPDKAWGQGPDNLWCLRNNLYLLVECKNQVKAERDGIAKLETGQINNSYAWFTSQYPGARAACVMVIPTNKLSSAAGFNMDVTIIKDRNLKLLVANVQSFFREFALVNLSENLDRNTIQKWLKAHTLEVEDILSQYSQAIHK